MSCLFIHLTWRNGSSVCCAYSFIWHGAMDPVCVVLIHSFDMVQWIQCVLCLFIHLTWCNGSSVCCAYSFIWHGAMDPVCSFSCWLEQMHNTSCSMWPIRKLGAQWSSSTLYPLYKEWAVLNFVLLKTVAQVGVVKSSKLYLVQLSTPGKGIFLFNFPF